MKKTLLTLFIGSQMLASAFAAIGTNEKSVLDEADLSIKRYAEVFEKALPQLNRNNFQAVCKSLLSAETKDLIVRLNKSDKNLLGLNDKNIYTSRMSEIMTKAAVVALQADAELSKACKSGTLGDDEMVLIDNYRSIKTAKTDFTVDLVKFKELRSGNKGLVALDAVNDTAAVSALQKESK